MAGERFRLVEGGRPEPRKRAHRLWDGCAQCEIDIGVRSRAILDIRTGPEVTAKGDLVGGRKVKACAMCLARGKLTALSV